MQKCYVSLQILLDLFVNPSFEINEIKCLWEFYFLLFKPLWEKWKMIQNFLSVENSVNHMATKQSHFYLVSQMGINFLIFMNWLENIWCSWTIWKFKLIEKFLVDFKFVPSLKILNWNVLQDIFYFIVCVFIN